eukprot:1175624-Alexandrium_andersonii.AAC.1
MSPRPSGPARTVRRFALPPSTFRAGRRQGALETSLPCLRGMASGWSPATSINADIGQPRSEQEADVAAA